MSNLSEEEQKAIEKIKNFMNNEEILQYKIKEKDIDTILNLIDRLKKENKELKEYIENEFRCVEDIGE